jgi:cytochrome c-type biogenesis protein CcmH
MWLRMFFIGVLVGVSLIAKANTAYPLDTPQQTAQFDRLLRELRCLVCQNQDLVDSNASLAQDLRNTVYQFVREGQSDDEIIHYLTSRYGDFILFKPPLRLKTTLLWFGPLLLLALGCALVWRALRSHIQS